jgi:hypothetical protein
MMIAGSGVRSAPEEHVLDRETHCRRKLGKVISRCGIACLNPSCDNLPLPANLAGGPRRRGLYANRLRRPSERPD